MTAPTYDLLLDQGSDFVIDLVHKTAGVVTDLTGYSARGQIRAKYSSASAAATFTCTISAPATGAIKVELSNTLSAALAAGKYVYDIEIYTAGDAIVTRVLEGNVTVRPEVTR